MRGGKEGGVWIVALTSICCADASAAALSLREAGVLPVLPSLLVPGATGVKAEA